MFDLDAFGNLFDGLRDGLLTGIQGAAGGVVDGVTGWLIHAGPALFVQGILILLGGLVTYFLGGATEALGAVSWLTRTPADVTYALPGIAELVTVSKLAAAALLTPGVALNGVGYSLGAIRDDAEDMARRIVTGAVGVFTIDRLLQLLYDVHNGLAGAFSHGAGLPGLSHAQVVEASLRGAVMTLGPLAATVGGKLLPAGPATTADTGQLLGAGTATVAYALFGLLAGGAALGRIGFLNALYVLAPLAMAAWVMPVGQQFTRGWAIAFATALFVQLVVDLLLSIMGMLVATGAASGDVWQLVSGIVAGLMAATMYFGACGMGAISLFRAARATVRVAAMFA